MLTEIKFDIIAGGDLKAQVDDAIHQVAQHIVNPRSPGGKREITVKIVFDRVPETENDYFIDSAVSLKLPKRKAFGTSRVRTDADGVETLMVDTTSLDVNQPGMFSLDEVVAEAKRCFPKDSITVRQAV